MPAHENDVLELDELWSYAGNKKNQVWLWIALCRRTRQVVAWHASGGLACKWWLGMQVVAWHQGSRSMLCCQQLWNKIPPAYKTGLIFTDFWRAYQGMVPDHQHRPCAKQKGETNHVERFNLTLRQGIGHLTRKTLSFSKSHTMHLIHIRAFFLDYNRYYIHRFNQSHQT